LGPKCEKLPKLRAEGGGVFWAMPKRKGVFIWEVFPYTYHQTRGWSAKLEEEQAEVKGWFQPLVEPVNKICGQKN